MTQAIRPRRRTILKSVAGAIAVPAAGLSAAAAQPVAQAPAHPGEFDFLNGDWRIENRRLLASGEWDAFEGASTCWSILEGRASVEELRIPARNFSGMGLRTLDAANGVWLDYWMNAAVGVPGPAGTPGRFVDGVGNFDSEETDDQGPVVYRGCWDQISANACRWRQGASRDGGQTWDWSWIMHWARA